MSIIGNPIIMGSPPQPSSGYTVIWLDWDNTVLSVQTYAAGATPVYPSTTPTRASSITRSYTFNGWEPAITTVSEDTVYKAKYITNITGCIEFSSISPFSLSHTKYWNGIIEYLNNGTTWTVWDGSEISSVFNSTNDYTISLRGSNNNSVVSSEDASGQFIVRNVDSLSLMGNIECLLDYQTVLNNQHPTMEINCFQSLFRNFKQLTHIDPNLLPATTLTDNCYLQMFYGSGIRELPNLPATTLQNYCYQGMFQNCSNITTLPTNLLSSTSLAISCYMDMFNGCTGLTSIPSTFLPATTLKTYCYSGMFQGCTRLTSIPNVLLPATTLQNQCYVRMFQDCTGLTSIPSDLLSATTLASYCYQYMFRGCTGLTTIPSNLLPTTTLKTYCYAYMFYDCSNITNIPNLPATTLQNYCYQYMFYGCTSLVHLPSGLFSNLTTLGTYCCRYMFYGCTALIDLVDLDPTSLKSNCFNSMFSGCSSIKLSTTQVDDYQTTYRIPSSGTGTTATNALANMFTNTGGTFTGTPAINTTYYTSNTVIS